MIVTQQHGNLLQWEFDLPDGVAPGTTEGDSFLNGCIGIVDGEMADLDTIVSNEPTPGDYDNYTLSPRDKWIIWQVAKIVIRAVCIPYGPFIPIP